MASAGTFDSHAGEFRVAGALLVLADLTTGAAKMQNALRPRNGGRWKSDGRAHGGLLDLDLDLSQKESLDYLDSGDLRSWLLISPEET